MTTTSDDQKLAAYIRWYAIRRMSLQSGDIPGFAHACKLRYNTIDLNRMSFGDKSLTYRYPLSKDIPRFTTGLLTALMDTLSTLAIFRVGLPGSLGMSLCMQTEVVRPDLLPLLEEVDIANTVTKLGKSTSHTRTEYFCPSTKELVGHSSHVKISTTGDKEVDAVMGDSRRYKDYMDKKFGNQEPKTFQEKPLWSSVILPHLQCLKNGRATFQVTPEHVNQYGSLHGGCHSMVIEEVALWFAKRSFPSCKLMVESMQVNFMRPGKIGQIQIVCEAIGEARSHPTSSRHVRVLLQQGGQICSEGKVRVVMSNGAMVPSSRI